jgi:DNA polymerase-1
LGSLDEAKSDADQIVSTWMKLLGAKDAVMALSCRLGNFRDSVLPSYKQGRDSSTRPAYLTDMKLHLAECYESHVMHHLEGDDVLGILQTDDTIIVSEDKDLRTVAGKLYAPHRHEVGLIEITPLEANQFLMWQTICGDSTDGYKGALGVGKRSPYAEAVLAADADELWDIVTDAYASVDMTEDEAIVQARCAKILTREFYDKKTGVRLWTPSDLEGA